MAPSKRRRSLESGDLEAKRAEEEKVITEYSPQPLDDRPEIAGATAERREGLIKEWREYVESYEAPSDQALEGS